MEGLSLRYVRAEKLDVDRYGVSDPPPLTDKQSLRPLFFEGSLFGVFLEASSCQQLVKEDEVYSAFISRAMILGMLGIRHIDCKTDAWGNALPPQTLVAALPTRASAFVGSPEHRTVSAFFQRGSNTRTYEESLRTPVPFRIRRREIYARDVDVAEFVHSLTAYRFISDLFDGKTIVKCAPKYVSKMLSELIDAHRTLWMESSDFSAGANAKRREQISRHLRGAFAQLCDKDSNPRTLAKFGTSFCNPFTKDGGQRLPTTLVTPDMLALLTASKLYWSPHASDSGTYETYPSSKPIISFLQFMGLTQLNAGRYGTTLIEPEQRWTKDSGTEPTPPQIDWPTTKGTLRPSL